MKKLILCFAIGAVTAANAQAQTTPTADNAKSGEMSKAHAPDSPLADINSLSKDVMGAMMPKLALSNDQSPKVLSLVTDFLTAKAAILPLLEKNPQGYSEKFGVIHGDLTRQLKGVLTPAQMNSFMGMMPKPNDDANVMSHLFF